MSDETRDSGPEAGVKGVVEGVKGKLKEAAGALAGDDELKEEGAASRPRRTRSARSRRKKPRPRRPAQQPRRGEAEQRSHQR